MKTVTRTTVLMAMLTAVVFTSAFGVRAEETDQMARGKFAQAYNGKRWKERLVALDELKGVKEDQSHQLLYHVSVLDTDPEVRLKAFRVLAACPDKVGYVAYLASLSLKAEKNMSVKFNKAAAMGSFSYKYHATEALADFLRRLRYRNPDWYYIDTTDISYTSDGQRAGNTHSWEGYEPDYWGNERAGMTILIGALNKIANSRLQVRPRVDQEIVEWWNRHKEYILEEDQKLRAKEMPNNTLDFSKLKMAKMDLVPGDDGMKKGVERMLEEKEEVKVAPAKPEVAAAAAPAAPVPAVPVAHAAPAENEVAKKSVADEE